MTSEGLGEMFEGDCADMCAGKFLLVLMVGRAEGLACADPVARTPIGASGNYLQISLLWTIWLQLWKGLWLKGLALVQYEFLYIC